MARSSVAIIPARGGSVRMPRKNVTPFMGQPLIYWTVKAALESGVVDRVLVNTDDPEIAQAGRAAGAEVPFMRPAHLATSEASTFDVIIDTFDRLELTEQTYVLLQPTSPLRTAHDVQEGMALFDKTNARAVVSVAPFDTPWPVLCSTDSAGHVQAVDTPQNGVPTLQLNGALYIGSIETLRETKSFKPSGTVPYTMSPGRSVDIDLPLDFQTAEVLARQMPDVFPQ